MTKEEKQCLSIMAITISLMAYLVFGGTAMCLLLIVPVLIGTLKGAKNE